MEIEVLSEVTQSCLTLCGLVDCSLPGSSKHEILQARILEWVAISFSRGSSQPRDQTKVSCIAGRCFTLWAIRELLKGMEWSRILALCNKARVQPLTQNGMIRPSLRISRIPSHLSWVLFSRNLSTVWL